MKIQVIQYTENSAVERDGLYFTPLRSPRALDDYDINVIDLSVDRMWYYKESQNIGLIDSKPDLLTICQMVENKRRSIVVYVLPQNITYHYCTVFSPSKKTPLKDIISNAYEHSIAKSIPGRANMPKLAFETTSTLIGGNHLDADFYFVSPTQVITESERSKKPTTICIADNVYVTTLAIAKTNASIKHYLSSLFEKHERAVAPEWMDEIIFGDDMEQREKIRQNNEIISAAQANIKVADGKLQENAKYKSVLYSTGDELVSVVFKILENLLSCDLSSFEDKKKEDFLIKTENCTFIGEVKGVNSNVKFENITQIGVHFGRYLDSIVESGARETVKQLLIINPFRNKPLNQREPIHKDQIEFAVRSDCLIIETSTLLRLFERFCNGDVTTSECKEILSSRSGLLSLADFDENAGDNEPYKI